MTTVTIGLGANGVAMIAAKKTIDDLTQLFRWASNFIVDVQSEANSCLADHRDACGLCV